MALGDVNLLGRKIPLQVLSGGVHTDVQNDMAAACGSKTPEATPFTDDLGMWKRVKVLGRSFANRGL